MLYQSNSSLLCPELSCFNQLYNVGGPLKPQRIRIPQQKATSSLSNRSTARLLFPLSRDIARTKKAQNCSFKQKQKKNKNKEAFFLPNLLLPWSLLLPLLPRIIRCRMTTQWDLLSVRQLRRELLWSLLYSSIPLMLLRYTFIYENVISQGKFNYLHNQF